MGGQMSEARQGNSLESPAEEQRAEAEATGGKASIVLFILLLVGAPLLLDLGEGLWRLLSRG